MPVFASVYPSIYLTICVRLYLSVYAPMWLLGYLTDYLTIWLSDYVSICLSVFYLSSDLAYPSIYLPERKKFCHARLSYQVDPSGRLQLENDGILRDFPSKIKNESWSSKRTKFCEASWILKVTAKNEAILGDILQMESWECLLRMRLAIFPLHVSRVLRLPWKSEARSYDCCACHAKLS